MYACARACVCVPKRSPEKPHPVDGGLVVAPVLQELRRKLYGVPRDLVDSGEVGVNLGQHVLQAVAELVEQRDNLEATDHHQGATEGNACEGVR